MRSEQRIWHYMVDIEGVVWHDGTEFDAPELLQFFMRKMEASSFKEASEKPVYEVICQGELCLIHAQDVPYVVQSLEIRADGVILIFPGGYREELDPRTLFVGGENVLYCKVRKGNFKARFNRKTYVELAKLIDFDPQKNVYFLRLGQNRFSIQTF